MAVTSAVNPSRNPFLLAQIEIDWPVSLSLSTKNWAESKRAVPFSLCPVLGLVSALRLLSGRAVPSAQVPRVYHLLDQPYAKGTFLLCIDREKNLKFS